MRRPASLAVRALVVPVRVVPILVVAAVGGASACHTDEPRRADDAGAIAPSTSTSPSTSADAGAAAVDAGGAVPVAKDAVPAAVPELAPDVGSNVVHDIVDAGHIGDAPAVPDEGAAMGSSGVGKPPPVVVDPIQVTIFNRILAKAKTRDLNPGQVQELAEQLTKQKVERARRTAGTFWLIQFAPTTPPRGKAEQQKLIEQLKAGGDFEFVEADQVMTAK
jgi:hypothetical protein